MQRASKLLSRFITVLYVFASGEVFTKVSGDNF